MALDYEKKRKTILQQNIKEVPKLLKKGDAGLEQRINNFAELYGFKPAEVRAAILNNKIISAFFAKDPRRQGIDEKIAGDFIKNISGVRNFKILPKTGKNALVVIRGEVREKSVVSSRSKAKSLDFMWEYKDKVFYATHKYTKDSGGSQDHQFSELREFVDETRDTEQEGAFFLIIADGAYYQGKTSRGGNKTKVEMLNDRGGSRVFATTIDNLESLLKSLTATH